MNKPSQPDTRKGKYDRDGDRLRGAVDSAADLVSGAETTMTESRGAMTAQRERQIKRILRTSGIKIKHSLMEGWLRAMWNDGYALSAHNTAQLQKEVERTKGYDAVLAEVGKLQGIVEAGDAENVELQAALEAARNEKVMLLIELQKYHIAERLRSQGAGPWPQDAARAYHDEICPRHANSCADCINRLSDIIRKHAPVEGAGQWETALRKAQEWAAKFPLGNYGVASAADIRAAEEVYESCKSALAGLASPPEGSHGPVSKVGDAPVSASVAHEPVPVKTGYSPEQLQGKKV